MKTLFMSAQTKGIRLNLCVQALLAAASLVVTSEVSAAPAAVEQVIRAPLFQRPLVWVGSQPSGAESEALLKDIDVFNTKGMDPGFAALEQFVATHPNSAWTPDLQVHLAEYDRARGRYSEALAYWQAAWNETKDSQDAAAQRLAVRDMAGWTRLLASLGRKDQLEKLFGELSARHLPLETYSTEIQETEEGLGMMKAKPGDSYRCGSYALGHLAMAMGLGNRTAQKLFDMDSPDGGFNMSELLALARSNGISVEAVHCPADALPVVPSVVHWKLNHYAAITEQKGNLYRVDDPTFSGHVWMTAATIAAESSGDYILPADKVPASWAKMSEVACARIYGMGFPNTFNDCDDDPPPDHCGLGGDGNSDNADSTCDPPSSNDGAASGGTPPPPPCPNCGMPQWSVSEPYITVWLTDTPLLYHQSDQTWMELNLSYKSRGTAQEPNIPGFGSDWSCNWLAMLQSKSGSPDTIEDYLAGGGMRSFLTDGTPDYKTGRRFATVGVADDDPPALVSPTGSENIYGYAVGDMSGDTNYFLTERLDRYGRVLQQFNYQNDDGVVQLVSAVDMDGKTNTLIYGDVSHPNLITAVTDRYGRSTYFNYDFSQDANGLLASIEDPQGMTSYFQYDADDRLTNMITLYGTTSFEYYESGNGTNSNTQRAALITEANSAQQLYMYQDDPPTDFGDMGSYHWNRAQYAAISADWLADGFSMPKADYYPATVKHWLHGANTVNGLTVSDTMAEIRSPYGTEGRPNDIVYTYQGQNGNYIGVNTAGGLQRVTSIWEWSSELGITRNSLGRPTSYCYTNSDGSVAVYTNIFDPSGTILEYELGPQGELTRGYGYDPVITNLLTSVTNAVGDVLRYTHDTNTLKVTSIIFPGGMIQTNVYYASGPYKGFLAMQADIGFRTNYFTYTNGNVFVQTNELGLVTTNTYDNLNRLLSTAYSDGTTVSNVYDKLDIVATKDRLNQWTYYGYNQVRQLVAATNADGEITTYDYCGCGSPDKITRYNGDSQLITTFSYDMDGMVTNAVYPDGYDLSFAYDPEDRIQYITDGANNQLNILKWYQHGLQSQPQIGKLNNFTLFSKSFDIYGRVTNSVDRNSVTVTNAYDLLGRLVARQSYGDGNQLGLESFGYGALGLTNYIDPLGHLTAFVRDLAGRVIAETNANNEVLQFAYNPADELTALTDGKNQPTHWNYDSFGRVTNKVDAAGYEDFVYQYDADNRLTNRWTPAKGATVYRYDPLGNLTNVDYSGGTVYTPSIYFAYDPFNRLTNMVDGIGSTAFSWTGGDQLQSEDGPWENDAVSYFYNDSRQRAGLSLQQPNASPWTQNYSYDTAMRLADLNSPAGDFTYGYSEASDHVSSLALRDDGTAAIYNSYDGLERLQSVSCLYNSQQIQTYDYLYYYYDSGSEATQIVAQAGVDYNSFANYMNYSYDKIGQLKTAQGFDGWPSDNPPNPPRLQEQFGYAYDKAWNLNQRTNNAMVETFNVNNVNELTTISRSGALTVAGTATEPSANTAYPGVTNVVVNGEEATIYGDGTFAATNLSAANGENTYTAIAQDNIGRLSTNSVTVNLPSSSSDTYDYNGNLTSDGTRNFAYDDENQLVGVWVADVWSNSFAYDGLMRKRIEQDYSWNGSSWVETNEIHFIYDRNLVIQERNASNVPQVTYTRGVDLSDSLEGAGGIGGLLARTENPKLLINDPFATAYYFAYDRGNVAEMVYTNGVVAAQYQYDPFGNMIAMSGPLAAANRYRFSSKEWNDNAGLYYYGYRFYDPNLQRWINRDPLSDSGSLGCIGPSLNPAASAGNNGGAQSADELVGLMAQINVNLYGAIGNAPLNLYDSFGLCPTPGGPGQGAGTGTGEQLGKNGNPPFTLPFPTTGLPDLPPFPQMPDINWPVLAQQSWLYPALVAGTIGKPGVELPEPDQYDINHFEQSDFNSVPPEAEAPIESPKPPVPDSIYYYNGPFKGLNGDQIDIEEPSPSELQLELDLGVCVGE